MYENLPLATPAPLNQPAAVRHEHGWRTESSHRTSEGLVRYVRCACGVRRIDRQVSADRPPEAVSRVLGRGIPVDAGNPE